MKENSTIILAGKLGKLKILFFNNKKNNRMVATISYHICDGKLNVVV